MSQLTLRVSEDLAENLKLAASSREMSLNGYVAAVLAAAIDPDLGETEMDRLRGRLARAGLLESRPGGKVRDRPDRERVEAARRRAGEGVPLADLVAEERR